MACGKRPAELRCNLRIFLRVIDGGKPFADRVLDQFRQGRDVQFGHEMSTVIIHGFLAHVQDGRDWDYDRGIDQMDSGKTAPEFTCDLIRHADSLTREITPLVVAA